MSQRLLLHTSPPRDVSLWSPWQRLHRPNTVAEVFKNGPCQVADEAKMGTFTGEIERWRGLRRRENEGGRDKERGREGKEREGGREGWRERERERGRKGGRA
ncbi:MAG: hypothetical protein MJE68_25700, partial [Proteobacteria bacterium]|nr:hypothetical protein [Pseudomonadota bacterium]